MSSKKHISPNGKESPTEHSKSLRTIGRKSARSALRENKALGLPVTYINRNRVIQEKPNGEKIVIGRRDVRSHASDVSKGDVIRVKRG